MAQCLYLLSHVANSDFVFSDAIFHLFICLSSYLYVGMIYISVVCMCLYAHACVYLHACKDQRTILFLGSCFLRQSLIS